MFVLQIHHSAVCVVFAKWEKLVMTRNVSFYQVYLKAVDTKSVKYIECLS